MSHPDNIDCPDPCAKTPDTNCDLVSVSEGDEASINLSVNIKLLTTKLIKDICECKNIIDFDNYPDDPNDPIAKLLSSLKLIITKKPNNEDPEESKCPVLKGKVRNDIDGTTNVQGSVDVNPGAGIVIDIGKDIKEYITELRTSVEYDPCCLQKAEIAARKIISLSIGTSKCHIPKIVKQFLINIADTFNSTEYDTLLVSNYNLQGNNYVVINPGKLSEITAHTLYVNRDTLLLIKEGENSEAWNRFELPSGAGEHPARTGARAIFDLGILDKTIKFGNFSGDANQYYENVLEKYNILIGKLQNIHGEIIAGSKNTKIKDCYDFTTLLKSGEEHSGTNQEMAQAQVALNFIQNVCTYAKKINKSSWDENLCKWIKCLGNEEKDDEGRFKIKDLTVKLVKADNTAYDKCYEDIPVSATLSGSGNDQTGINYNLNIEIGNAESCAEGGGCKDRYYAQIKQKLEYDFSSANCSTVNENFLDLECNDFDSDTSFEAGSVISISDFDDDNVESVTRISKDQKYAYKAYRCKKCEDIYIVEEMKKFRENTSGVCCREGEYETVDAVDFVAQDKNRVPLGAKDSQLTKYSVFNKNTTFSKCCEYKGYFWKQGFDTANYIVENNPLSYQKSLNTIESECLPSAVCCVPEVVDTIGVCYYKQYNPVVDTYNQANDATLKLDLKFTIPLYTVDPDDCNDGIDPEDLFTCNIGYPLFTEVEGSDIAPVKFAFNTENLLGPAFGGVSPYGIPDKAKRQSPSTSVATKLTELSGEIRAKNIPRTITILRAMNLLYFKRNGTVRYSLDKGKTFQTKDLTDFIKEILSPMLNTENLVIDTLSRSLIKDCVKVRALFTTKQKQNSDILKKSDCVASIATGKKTFEDSNIYKWMRDQSTKYCSLSKVVDKELTIGIQDSLCLDASQTYPIWRLIAIDPASVADPSKKNVLKFWIKDNLSKDPIFTFVPGKCKYDTGSGNNDQFFDSACMNEECCKKFCDTNGVTYVGFEKSKGQFPGFEAKDLETKLTNDNSIIPTSNDIEYIEYSNDIKTQLISDLADYIVDTKDGGNNARFKLFVNGQDISELTVEEFAKLVKTNHTPCGFVLESQLVHGADENELKTKCENLANENFYNKCSCVDTTLNDAEGIVAECEKEYLATDVRYVLVKGTPGSVEVLMGKQKTVEVNIGFATYTSGPTQGMFLDQVYRNLPNDLPNEDIEISYIGSEALAQIKKSVTRAQLEKGKLIEAELQQLKVLPPAGTIKAILKYNSNGTLNVGKCSSSGCVEIEPLSIGDDGEYIPAAHLCTAQTEFFRKYYRVFMTMPVDSAVRKQHTGYGGILKPDAPSCFEGICDGATHPEISEPEESEPPIIIEPEADSPVVEVTDDIKPECLDEYNKAKESVKKIKDKIILRLTRFERAAAEYRLADISDTEKRQQLKVILSENYFGDGTKTISDGTTNGFVIDQRSPIGPATISKSCEILMDRLDDAGSKLAEIKERCSIISGL